MIRTLLAIACLFSFASCLQAAERPDYVVVVSRPTHDDPEWSKVCDALLKKHHGKGLVYGRSITETLDKLQADHPKYVCFVATPAEAGRQFVADVHRLMRKIDDDPYTDAIWGILTGYDAKNALAIAETTKPLEVKKVASGTEVALDRCVEGMWYCELEKNRFVKKEAGGEAAQSKGPNDTTKALADTLNDYKADLFITSGHATERDWQIGFRYQNGSFRSKAGELFGVDTKGEKFPIHSDSPKVYLPIGNCLMGHIDGPDAMALAFMNSAGVRQMIGYTVLTWYGYAGWGCLDYFVEQPGRYTFAEAFLANEHALIHRLETNFPELAKMDLPPGSTPRARIAIGDAAKQVGLTQQDGAGLLHDRDVVAFYGDPAWEAKMAPGKLAYEQTLTARGDGTYVFEIKPLAGEKSFEPVNTNGAQRGWRPIVQFFPQRLGKIEVLEGSDLQPVIADDFLLVPNPRKCNPAKTYRIVFKAETIAPQQ
jgi:zinc protease